MCAKVEMVAKWPRFGVFLENLSEEKVREIFTRNILKAKSFALLPTEIVLSSYKQKEICENYV